MSSVRPLKQVLYRFDVGQGAILAVTWLRHLRREKLSPQALAKVFYETLIEERSDDDLAQRFEVPLELVPVFRQKVTLYREAVILMCLIAESENQGRFAAVQSAYEGILFGRIITVEGSRKLAAIRTAMADLDRAIDTRRNSGDLLFWARDWWADIGRDIHNPVANCLLGFQWMDEYIYTTKTIKECLARSLRR